MAGPRIAIKLKHARTNRQSIAYPFREGAETQDLFRAMALSPAQFSLQANAIGENCQHGRFQAQARSVGLLARPIAKLGVGVARVCRFECLPTHTPARGRSAASCRELQHPIFGVDHLLAMLAVGIWGAQMGGRESGRFRSYSRRS